MLSTYLSDYWLYITPHLLFTFVSSFLIIHESLSFDSRSFSRGSNFLIWLTPSNFPLIANFPCYILFRTEAFDTRHTCSETSQNNKKLVIGDDTHYLIFNKHFGWFANFPESWVKCVLTHVLKKYTFYDFLITFAKRLITHHAISSAMQLCLRKHSMIHYHLSHAYNALLLYRLRYWILLIVHSSTYSRGVGDFLFQSFILLTVTNNKSNQWRSKALDSLFVVCLLF